jgi:hypothetical protein
MSGTVLRPEDLRRISKEREWAELRETLARDRRNVERERARLGDALTDFDQVVRDAFMDFGTVAPDVLIMERVLLGVRHAAERHRSVVLAMSFPAGYCADGGRAIDDLEPGWPASLRGRAKAAHEFFERHLHPLGYELRAEVLTRRDGAPGEVGLFLSW